MELTDRVPPHDLLAEESLLGAMMLSREAIASVIQVVNAGDFYRPAHGSVFAAITELYNNGDPTDSVSVADLLRRQGALEAIGGHAALAQILASTPSTTSAVKYARIVVDHASLRRIAAIAFDTYEQALGLSDVRSILDAAQAALNEIALPQAALPVGLWRVTDYLARPKEDEVPWVIPGLFRRGWRAVFVAEEGMGKTLVAQQLCLAAAKGVHPFAFTEIPPIVTLLVDAENPEDRIKAGFQMVNAPISQRTDDGRAWLWEKPEGLNLRSRVDRGRLEAVIAEVRPRFVAMGPIYKLYSITTRESDEIAAREVMAVLDDLRTRYGFALLLEHHAPKKQNGYREMLPYGSSLWLRWPEFGFAMRRHPSLNREGESRVFEVGRFRADRLPAAWPETLEKSQGGGFPWSAGWKDAGWQDVSAGREPAPIFPAEESPF